MFIYCILNNVNGKVYIGQTIYSVWKRWLQHLRGARGGDLRHLYCAIRKYGVENFTVEIIDRASCLEELNKKEIHWIAAYCATNPKFGYNNSSGGDNAIPTEETRKKQSISHRRWHREIGFSEESRRKISESLRGRTVLEATRRLISSSTKGRVVSEETRNKLSNSLKGRKCWTKGLSLSEEHRKNIADALRGKPLSEEHREKIRKRMIEHKPWLGRKHTEETRKKQSESHKGQIPWNKGKTNIYSEETLKKMHKPRSEDSKRRISESKIGNSFGSGERTGEAKKNISDGAKRGWEKLKQSGYICPLARGGSSWLKKKARYLGVSLEEIKRQYEQGEL